MTQKYGHYSWTCPYCKEIFERDTPQGLGLTKSNHLRKHAVPVPPRPDYIPRDYEQYPEEICGEMSGDCMNCPVPANMRGMCCEKDEKGPGYDTGTRTRT